MRDKLLIEKNIDKLWKLFNKNCLNEVTQKNRKHLDGKLFSLAAAKLSKDVYDDDFESVVLKNYDFFPIKENKFSTKAILVIKNTNNKEGKNAILIIRGTLPPYPKSFCQSMRNWGLNFYIGYPIALVIFLRLLFFILSFYWLINTLGYEKNILYIFKVCVLSFVLTSFFTILTNWILFFLRSDLALVHTGYRKISKEINDKINLNRKIENILVLGHSLGGGVADAFLNTSEIDKRMGILFNKSFYKVSKNAATDLRTKAVDHRLYFDLLSVFTFVFIMPVENLSTLRSSMVDAAYKKFKYFFRVYISIILLALFCNKLLSIVPQELLVRILDFFSALFAVSIFIPVCRIVIGLFPINHLMWPIICELEKNKIEKD